MHSNFNPRLIFIIPPAEQVPDADNSLKILQQICGCDKLANYFCNHRIAAQTSANDHLKSNCTLSINHAQTNVMGARHRPVAWAARECDFELAWQKLKFGVVGGPLPDQFGIRARVLKLVGCSAGKMVSSDVSNGVSRGLDRIAYPRRLMRREYRLYQGVLAN